MALTDDLEKRRRASADALRRARDSIDLEDASFEEDTRNTHIHATGSKIVVQNVGAGNVKAGLDTTSLAPKSKRPLKVTLIEGGKIAAVLAGLAALLEGLRQLWLAMR